MTTKVSHITEDEIHKLWSDLGMIVLALNDVAHDVHVNNATQRITDQSEKIQEIRVILRKLERAAK